MSGLARQAQSAGESATSDVSVVIVSYNTRDLLDACLASIDEPCAEIIVVDNGSSDGTVDLVHAHHVRCRLVEMGENTGFARASNIGMRLARGRYVLLLNSDTVVLEHAVSGMALFLDSHPQFALAGPLLLNGDGTIQTSCFAFTTVRDVLFEQLGLTALFPRSSFFNRRGLGGFDRASVRVVDWVSGACLMARRDVLEQVGLLDEGFFMYGEELDWCVRMKQAGLQVAFYPGARVVHYGSASSRRTRGELAPRALAGRLRYFARYHGARAVLTVRLLTVAGMGLRLLTMPPRALFRPRMARSYFEWYWGLLRAAIAYSGQTAQKGQTGDSL